MSAAHTNRAESPTPNNQHECVFLTIESTVAAMQVLIYIIVAFGVAKQIMRQRKACQTLCCHHIDHLHARAGMPAVTGRETKRHAFRSEQNPILCHLELTLPLMCACSQPTLRSNIRASVLARGIQVKLDPVRSLYVV